MYKELKDKNIIVEINELVKKADEFKSDLDMYCEFMRERFLAVSGNN